MTKTSTFRATVKERNPGEPCFVVLETYDEIGLGKKQVSLWLPPGTDYECAKKLADMLNAAKLKVAVD